MLDKLNNNKNPFTVPESYFENFNDRIMDMLPTKETKAVKKKTPIWKKTVSWISAAAIFCGIIVTAGILKDNYSQSDISNSNGEVISTIDENELFMYFEEELATSAMYKEAAFSE